MLCNDLEWLAEPTGTVLYCTPHPTEALDSVVSWPIQNLLYLALRFPFRPPTEESTPPLDLGGGLVGSRRSRFSTAALGRTNLPATQVMANDWKVGKSTKIREGEREYFCPRRAITQLSLEAIFYLDSRLLCTKDVRSKIRQFLGMK